MNKKDFIHLQQVTKDDVGKILQKAKDFHRGTIKVPLFFEQKPVLSTFFLENSTRTKLSFQKAAMDLGLHVLPFEIGSSSINKSETIEDSLRCIEEMGVRLCVIRCKEEELLSELAAKTSMSIISGGEGTKSHPSQALLDAATMLNHFENLKGLKLSIVGDCKHSRVAHSHMDLAKLMGIDLRFCGPDHFLSDEQALAKISVEEALESSDIVMMLRIQFERHQNSFDTKDYLREFGLDELKLKNLNPSCKIMHPGPFNIGNEITRPVVESSQSLIWEQVKMSIPTRMAIINDCLEGVL
ncbi:MAG: aspartate carbamoyltransferase catalytic subunit [Bdellovibrionales bacterium]